MTVQVGKFQKPASIISGEKPVSSKAKSNHEQDKGIFESLLSNIKGSSGDTGSHPKSTANHLQYRPPTSMITNPEYHKARATGVNSTNSAVAQNINNMAVSALISLSALSSGRNRMNNLQAMPSGGMSSPVAASSAPSYSTAGSNRTQGIGALSAKFESGEKGPEIIGYDGKGGTAYGTFQISSRAGTMRQFIDYLSEKAPDLARKLEAAGPANTGCRRGRMPEVWKKIANEDTARFSKLQYDFIEQSHYLPAVQEIAERTGVDIGQSPKALREVLWSTAVQHGAKGAAKIFTRAIGRSKAKDGGIQAKHLINSVYNMRAGQFGSSTAGIRAAVQNRFRQEGKIALAMLSEPFAPDTVTT